MERKKEMGSKKVTPASEMGRLCLLIMHRYCMCISARQRFVGERERESGEGDIGS